MAAINLFPLPKLLLLMCLDMHNNSAFTGKAPSLTLPDAGHELHTL